MTTKPAMSLDPGERIIVETSQEPPFEAVVVTHLGWGLVHGVIELRCQRADAYDEGSEEGFTYSIPHKAPVEVVG